MGFDVYFCIHNIVKYVGDFFVCVKSHDDSLQDMKSMVSEDLQSWPKGMAKTAKNGVVLDTTSNVQPIKKTICRECK